MTDQASRRCLIASFILGIVAIALLLGPVAEFGGFAIGAVLVLLVVIVALSGYLVYRNGK